jgi:hypothetical protein
MTTCTGVAPQRGAQSSTHLPERPPHVVHARGDVAPLVTATHLCDAAVVSREARKVVALEQLVRELGEAEAALGVQPRSHRLAVEHGVHAEVAARRRQVTRRRDARERDADERVTHRPTSRTSCTALMFL